MRIPEFFSFFRGHSIKAIYSWLLLTIVVLGLVGCSGEAGYSPPILIPIRISVNTDGEISVGVSTHYATPIGIFDLGLTGSKSYKDEILVFAEREYPDKHLLIVRVDTEVTMFELEADEQFRIEFENENSPYKRVALEHEKDGDIVLELVSAAPKEEIAQSNSEGNDLAQDRPTATFTPRPGPTWTPTRTPQPAPTWTVTPPPPQPIRSLKQTTMYLTGEIDRESFNALASAFEAGQFKRLGIVVEDKIKRDPNNHDIVVIEGYEFPAGVYQGPGGILAVTEKPGYAVEFRYGWIDTINLAQQAARDYLDRKIDYQEYEKRIVAYFYEPFQQGKIHIAK